MRYFIIGITLLSLSLDVAGATTSAVSGDALDADLSDDAQAAGSRSPLVTAAPLTPPVTTVRVAPPTASAPERAQSANPLWEIPLARLSATRERPIFSPSRRPPPSAVAAEPAIVKAPVARKKEPEAPQLVLVGTIASDEEGFGIFLDQSTKGALRLKIGEDYYPDASKRAGEEGRCIVTITVAADGRITNAAIQTSSGFPRLDEACLKAVKDQRVKPATEDGKPVETTAALPIVWKLTK